MRKVSKELNTEKISRPHTGGVVITAIIIVVLLLFIFMQGR